MDYYSPETPLADGTRKLASSQSLLSFGFIEIFNVGKRVAEIPGSGETGRISFTAADDVGGLLRLRVASVGEWPVGEWEICRGSYTPYQVLEAAEGVRGKILHNSGLCEDPFRKHISRVRTSQRT